jgi:hypothetical protein
MIDPRKALIVAEDLKAGEPVRVAARHAHVSPDTAYRIRRELLACGAIVPNKIAATRERYDLNVVGRKLARAIYVNLKPMLKKEPKLEDADEAPDLPGLTGYARRVLNLMWDKPGRILDAEFIIAQIWDEHSDTILGNLRVHIYRLRQAIKHTGAKIHTYENPLGYSLPRGEREKITAASEIIHLPELPRLSIHGETNAAS